MARTVIDLTKQRWHSRSDNSAPRPSVRRSTGHSPSRLARVRMTGARGLAWLQDNAELILDFDVLEAGERAGR